MESVLARGEKKTWKTLQDPVYHALPEMDRGLIPSTLCVISLDRIFPRRYLPQERHYPAIPGKVSTGTTVTNKKNGKFQTKDLTAFDSVDEVGVTRYQPKIKEADYLSKEDTDQILIGSLLDGNEDESLDKVPSLGGIVVGDRVEVAYSNGIVKSYRVKGIFETEGALIDSAAFITRAEMDSVMHMEGMTTEILVRGTSAETAGSLKYTIMNYGVEEKVRTWTEKGKGI